MGVIDLECGFAAVDRDGVLVELVAFEVQDQELMGIVDDWVEADVDFLVGYVEGFVGGVIVREENVVFS